MDKVGEGAVSMVFVDTDPEREMTSSSLMPPPTTWLQTFSVLPSNPYVSLDRTFIEDHVRFHAKFLK